MSSRSEHRNADVGWLLDDMVKQVVGIRGLVVLSSDGLVIASSQGMDKEESTHMAAVASAFHSLARSTSAQFAGGGVRQTAVEMQGSVLLVTAAGAGACLAVYATADAELGNLAYETGRLVRRVGSTLSAAPRSTGADRR